MNGPAPRIGLALAAWALMAGVALSTSAGATSLEHNERPLGVALKPLFKLTTHERQTISRSDLRGKPFVVLFGYTNCTDLCPTSLFEASILLRELGQEGDGLAVLFVTVDPEHDTPEQLKSFLEAFDSRIIGLTGTRDEIAAVTTAFEAPFKGRTNKPREGDTNHSSQLFFMDRFGLLAKPVDYTNSDALGAMARRLLAQ
jgi:protein SCO1